MTPVITAERTIVDDLDELRRRIDTLATAPAVVSAEPSADLVARIVALEERPPTVVHQDGQSDVINAIVAAMGELRDRMSRLEARPQVMADTGALAERIARIESVHTLPVAPVVPQMPDLAPLMDACGDALRRVGAVENLLRGLIEEAKRTRSAA